MIIRARHCFLPEDLRMATRKKAKKKAATRKPAARKKAAPKKKLKKAKAARPKARPGAAPRPAPKAAVAPKPMAPPPAAPPGEERIGIVTHYYTHLGVAIVKLESGSLRQGETVHVKGHTSDFVQPIESMEVEHMHVEEVRPGQSFGLRVKEHAREHDVVYKVKR
jgi:putative protease